MRITIDLPDALFRRVKAQAALEGRKLKDLIAELLEDALERDRQGDVDYREARRHTTLPVIPATGVTIPPLTNLELAQIEDDEDLARFRRSAGP